MRHDLNLPSLVTKEASSTGIGLHLIVVGQRGPKGIPNNPGCCPDYRLLSATDGKAPLLKTPIQLTEHGEVKLVPTQNLHPISYVFGTGRYSEHYQKKKM